MRISQTIVLFLTTSTISSFGVADISTTPLGVPSNIEPRYIPIQTSNIFAAKDTYGMRSNAVVAAFQANPEKPFDFPILGFNTLEDMAAYSDRDSVGLYADNTAPALKAWEILNKTEFTLTTLISEDINEQKIQPGMILNTEGETKWTSYVLQVNKNKIITPGWINTKTKQKGVPPAGSKVLINPITKIWATNFNIFLPENSLASSAVIQENGLINANIQHPYTLNGIDTVVLPQSKYGGTAAYLARSAIDGYRQRWLVGFMSQGNEVNFTSTDSLINSPSVGFFEDSSAQDGVLFSGRNKQNSIVWKSEGRILASIDPNGLITKIGYKTETISDNTEMSDSIGRYIINNQKNITLKLPNTSQIFAGYTVKISKVTPKGTITFVTSDKDVMINGNEKEMLNEKPWNKEAFFDGKNWFIL